MTNNTISINYSDEKLRILVEEYITQQRTSFTLRGVCSYVLYWAMEEGKATHDDSSLIEGETVCQEDSERICHFLNQIVSEGRIVAKDDMFVKNY